ncbi:amino acid transporter [Xylariaceae sp. FL0255]|nr:amino acid transporter [Xylariaceae sp. FL0255]
MSSTPESVPKSERKVNMNAELGAEPTLRDTASADELLANMGYKAELSRNRSTLQVAFMSFVLASIPYGLATTLYYPLICGGPVDIIWGWVLVSLVMSCVAASLGEITSVYPTAGGVYYQAWMLAGDSYRKIAAWVCGWLFVIGNVTITLSVNFGTTLFLVSCVNVFQTADGKDVLAGSPYQVFLIFLAITLLCNVICAFCNKWLPIIDTFAIFWTFAGVIAILITVLVVANHGRHTGEYVLGHFETNSGWIPGWSFFVGLLHAAYATSSTGMIISMCEEVKAPATQVPKAMILTILLNTICGLLFLVPLVFVLPDIKNLITLQQPTPAIIKSAVGSPGGAFGLLIPLIVLGLICGIGCTTAASRCVYAFSRDGAIPGSEWWKVVNPKLNVPVNALLLSMVVQLLLSLINFASAVAFNAFSGVGVITLTTSYAVPIAVSMLEGRRTVQTAKFHLGKLGWLCNGICIAWTALAIPLFSVPTIVPVTDPKNVNYAPVVFVGFLVVSLGWYVAWGRKNYSGPPA